MRARTRFQRSVAPGLGVIHLFAFRFVALRALVGEQARIFALWQKHMSRWQRGAPTLCKDITHNQGLPASSPGGHSRLLIFDTYGLVTSRRNELHSWDCLVTFKKK